MQAVAVTDRHHMSETGQNSMAGGIRYKQELEEQTLLVPPYNMMECN
jgi:hypothetical protein